MAINYTYTIVSVSEEARCMEIVYTAEGHETQHVGARLPYEGETTEQVVRMYSPVNYWLEKMRAVKLPAVGESGAINAADEQAAMLAALQAQEAQPTVEGAQTL